MLIVNTVGLDAGVSYRRQFEDRYDVDTAIRSEICNVHWRLITNFHGSTHETSVTSSMHIVAYLVRNSEPWLSKVYVAALHRRLRYQPCNCG